MKPNEQTKSFSRNRSCFLASSFRKFNRKFDSFFDFKKFSESYGIDSLTKSAIGFLSEPI